MTNECKASYDAGNVVPLMQRQCRFENDSPSGGGFLFTPLSPLRFGAQFPMIQQFIKNLLLPIINSELIASCHGSDKTFLPDYEIWHAGFWVRLLNAG